MPLLSNINKTAVFSWLLMIILSSDLNQSFAGIAHFCTFHHRPQTIVLAWKLLYDLTSSILLPVVSIYRLGDWLLEVRQEERWQSCLSFKGNVFMIWANHT